MFVNVSTDADDVPETLCSLRFAARAHDVALGQAKKNGMAIRPRARPPCPDGPAAADARARHSRVACSFTEC